MGFFSQFSDLDLESMQENRRLIKHAVKVIDTVTFVVDSIGDHTKRALLDEALVNLVRGHLKRRIGLREFRNLGIVLIDFICDLNQRRHTGAALRHSSRLLSGGSDNGPNSSASSSQDSETMTIALDKIRASSSPSSSSEGESLALLAAGVPEAAEPARQSGGLENSNHSVRFASQAGGRDEPASAPAEPNHGEPDGQGEEAARRRPAKLDTGLLVAAWTKLYGTILELVESEEASQ